MGEKLRGRPRLNPIEGKRRNITSQVSVELYDRLRAASDASGLSISREFEKRVERSFECANPPAHQVRALGEVTYTRRVGSVEITATGTPEALRSAGMLEPSTSRSPLAERFLSEQPEPYINQSAPPH